MNKKNQKKNKQKGQAMFAIVGLLSLGLLVLSTNILIGIIEHNLSLSFQQSDQGRVIAEAGLEEASIRLLRDPEYDGGQLVINGRNVIIGVSGENPKTISSSVNYFGKLKRVRAEVIFASGENQLSNWEEY